MVEKFMEDGQAVISCPNCGNDMQVFVRNGELHYSECYNCRYLPELPEIQTDVEKALLSINDLWDLIIVCPSDNEVICDFCNATVGPEEEGGCFISSYAVCPNCTKNRLSKQSLKNAELVKGSFVKAVLQKRGQDLFGIFDNPL